MILFLDIGSNHLIGVIGHVPRLVRAVPLQSADSAFLVQGCVYNVYIHSNRDSVVSFPEVSLRPLHV